MGCSCKKKKNVKTSNQKEGQENAEKPKGTFKFPGL